MSTTGLGPRQLVAAQPAEGVAARGALPPGQLRVGWLQSAVAYPLNVIDLPGKVKLPARFFVQSFSFVLVRCSSVVMRN